MNPIQFSAQIDKATANNDRTLTLKVETQELPSADVAKILEFFQKQVWICIAETSITKEQLNIPEVVDEMDTKSPSQRLRDRMAVYYKEKFGKFEGFDGWYKSALEKIGSSYLEKLQ